MCLVYESLSVHPFSHLDASADLALLGYVQLLFPTADAARPFSMLGLGDIVIPG